MNRHGGLTEKGKHGRLPGWARRCSEVVQLCEVNSGFRDSVMKATDPRFKRVLISKAREVIRKTV